MTYNQPTVLLKDGLLLRELESCHESTVLRAFLDIRTDLVFDNNISEVIRKVAHCDRVPFLFPLFRGT